MQLRQKLFLVLSLMAMVPLLFLLFEVLGRIEADLEGRTEAELQQTLGNMSQEIASLMDNQEALVRGLARVPAVGEFANLVGQDDVSAKYDQRAQALGAFFLDYQSTVSSIQAVRFTDTLGRTLVKVKEGRLVPNKYIDQDGRAYAEDIAYKPFFQYAMASENPVSISDFERGKVAGEVDFCPAMVRYSVPVYDDFDTRQGLLTVNMWGRRVDDAVEATLGGYPGTAYIAEISDNPERDGIFLYHKDPKMRFANQLGTDHRFSNHVGENVWTQIRQAGLKGTVNLDDGRMLFFRKYSPYVDRPTQWVLTIEVARGTVLAPISEIRNWIGFLIAAMLVISLLIARWAAARLAHPVHELAQIISRYADGDQRVRYEDSREDEIGAAGRAFNDMAASLERARKERDKAEQAVRQSERLAAIGQMAAGIGHEINNPLMNIMSLAQLVEDSLSEGDKQARDDLSALQKEGRRCARIVQGVLNFARETEPRYQPFDLAQMIKETIGLFDHRIKSGGLRLESDIQEPLAIEGDSNQLQQVLVNVMLNAIHASPADTTIAIQAKRDGEQAVVEVLDSGSGISEEALPKVFNPFFSTKPEGSWTGLGLSVSYGIIKKHNGTITLENREPRGVRVRIVLPVRGALGLDQEPAAEVEVRDVG